MVSCVASIGPGYRAGAGFPETLALTACHPPRTDVQRLVVFAERADA